jgi:predicted transcriptional regulator
MPRERSELPTGSELEILKVIWKRGPSTVREVYRELAAERDMGYSTVLKFMQIMTAKGSLVRDDRVRPQMYRSARTQRQTQQGLLRDLVTRAFDGSPTSLVMQALATRKASVEERRQIRALLDEIEEKER